MQTLITEQLTTLFSQTLINRIKPGDDYVLSDEILSAIAQGKQSLNDEQFNRVIDSPLTLRKLRLLVTVEKRRLQHEQHQEIETLHLLAASDGNENLNNGNYSIHFDKQDNDTWDIIISSKVASHKQGDTITVLDAQQNIVLEGSLDEDNELVTTWPIAQSPHAFLHANASSLSIVHN